MKNIIGRIKCLFSKHEFVFKDSRLEYDHNKHVYYHRIVNECKYCERQSHEFLISRVSNRNIIGFFAYVLLADSKNYGHDRLDKSNRQRRNNQID